MRVATAARDERDVNAEFFVRPRSTAHRTGKLAVSANAVNTSTFLFGWPSLLVVGLATLAAMSFFSSCNLASVSGVTSLRGVEKDAKLVLVLFQILQPVLA